MEEKLRFVFEYQRDEQTMTELCATVLGIYARDTGYVWLRRFRLNKVRRTGRTGPGCQAPSQPDGSRSRSERSVLELRAGAHAAGGHRKLKRDPGAGSTGTGLACGEHDGRDRQACRIGHSRARKRRRTEPYTQPLGHAVESNRVWCADFKGWFRSGDGSRVDPLTITDAWSRYLLRCQAVEKTDTERVRAIFEAAFREHGLPEAIRTDNGAPFASSAVGGLSRLVWWARLGIDAFRGASRLMSGSERAARAHASHAQAGCAVGHLNWRSQQRELDRFRHRL